MGFIADLHIHSRFSRATSKALTPRHLAAWARCKGIHVLGTGDFTHPEWRAELRQQLVQDSSTGLYRLSVTPEEIPFISQTQPSFSGNEDLPLFIPQTEISSIYKRHGKVRKIHNLVFVPTLDDADRLSKRLSSIGNLSADGRPILGLDSHDLLEILLTCVPNAVLIPAHIWTPWFALFGSKSGFDRIEECFSDLTNQIFALETGLSSDPAMNRLISDLDGYALISNSDAHSGPNLGREANLFEGMPSYDGIFSALRLAARREAQDALHCRFLGTMEFYPDEGKYHLDGHRSCNVVLDPQEAQKLGNLCPVCGKPLTVGVLHRVLELADRIVTPTALSREPVAKPLIPLAELVGEILGAGITSRKVQEQYARLLRTLGPELTILCSIPVSDIRNHWEPLGEAVERMRNGQVFRHGGYDGVYGKVHVFSPDELSDMGYNMLPGLRSKLCNPLRARKIPQASLFHSSIDENGAKIKTNMAAHLNPIDSFSGEQQKALYAGPKPVLVLAGPGAGKTHILVGRINRLLSEGITPSRIFAITFTRRAAEEIRSRLKVTFSCKSPVKFVQCDTLHAIAWKILCESATTSPILLNEEMAANAFYTANSHLPSHYAQELWIQLGVAREMRTLSTEPSDSPLSAAALRYTERKRSGKRLLVDYTDLLEWWFTRIRTLSDTQRPLHVLVDEVQDLSILQLNIVQALLPEDGSGFFGIGDPDQSIYGFRGASGQSEKTLRLCWPKLLTLRLGQSHRSCQSILDMSRSLMLNKGQCGQLHSDQTFPAELRLFTASNAQSEARWVASRISDLIGATSHTILDQNTKGTEDSLSATLAPGDIGVLVRIKAQLPIIKVALDKAGIPCAAPADDSLLDDSSCGRLLAQVAPLCGFGDAFSFVLPYNSRCNDSSLPTSWYCSLPEPELMQNWLKEQDWAGDIFLSGNTWKKFCLLWNECGSWHAFLNRLVWLREDEAVKAKAERVQLITLHASKGLEFKAVFLPGLEDGILPLRRDVLFQKSVCDINHIPLKQDCKFLDEERRLLYVGITRAARAIFISFCSQRRLFGKQYALPPSPFLSSISKYCRCSKLTQHVRYEHKPISLI